MQYHTFLSDDFLQPSLWSLSHTLTRPISISNIHRTAQIATPCCQQKPGEKYDRSDLMYVNVIKTFEYSLLWWKHSLITRLQAADQRPLPLFKETAVRVRRCTRQQVSTLIVRAHTQPSPRPNCTNYRRTAGKADAVSQKTSSQLCATPNIFLIITSVQEAEGIEPSGEIKTNNKVTQHRSLHACSSVKILR